MMSKLLRIASKNKLLYLAVGLVCRFSFFGISVWNELAGYLRLTHIGGGRYRKLKALKGIHDGERCFIIATGPSLTVEDLEKLEKEYTFGMNSIVKVYGDTGFRPTFYGIQDHLVYEKIEKDIQKYYKSADNLFVSDRIARHFKIQKSWYVFPLNIAYHAYRRWFKNEFRAKFSDDIYRMVYSGFSITYSLIEIAAYMGFKEIYLIGADCCFEKNKPLHFAETGVVDKTLDTARDRNLAGYHAAEKFAKQHGFRIFNATRGGALEVFERVDLDEVLKRKHKD